MATYRCPTCRLVRRGCVLSITYDVRRGRKGWWIVGDPWCKFMGPYKTKGAANRDKTGLKRSLRKRLAWERKAGAA